MKSDARITGIMVQYYYACKRELWFFGNRINMNYDDQNILIGRQIQDQYYQDRKKNLLIDGIISVDFMEDGQHVVEVKKSSRLERPAKEQLKYYLWYLKVKKGVEAKGVMAYPEERKREEVKLTAEDERRLEGVCQKIREVILTEVPPTPERQPFCPNCSYHDLCWI